MILSSLQTTSTSSRIFHSNFASDSDSEPSTSNSKPSFADAEKRFRYLEQLFSAVAPNSTILRPVATQPLPTENLPQLKREFLKLKVLLKQKAELELVRNYAKRKQNFNAIRIELFNIFDEQITLRDHLSRNMNLDLNLKHTYLEYVLPLAKALRLEAGFWQQLHYSIKSNKWLCCTSKWLLNYAKETTKFVQQLIQLLRIFDSVLRVGLSTYSMLMQPDQQLCSKFLEDFCNAIEDFNWLVKQTCRMQNSTHFCQKKLDNKYTTLHLADADFVPKPFSLVDLLSQLGQNDGHVISVGFMTIFASKLKPTVLFEDAFNGNNLLQQFLTTDFVRCGQVSELENTQQTQKAEDCNKEMLETVRTSDYYSSSASSSVASDHKTVPIASLSLSRDSVSLDELNRKLQQFLKQRRHVVSALISKASRYQELSHDAISKQLIHTKHAVKVSCNSSGAEPKAKKCISWLEDKIQEHETKILDIYLSRFWQSFNDNVTKLLQYNSGDVKLPSALLSNPTPFLLIISQLSDTLNKALVNHFNSLQLRSLLAYDVGIKIWDSKLCLANRSIIADKCQPVPFLDNCTSTTTAKLIHAAWAVLNCPTLNPQEHMFQTIRQSTKQLAQHWLLTRILRSLASTNWSQVFLIRFADAKVLRFPTSFAETDAKLDEWIALRIRSTSKAILVDAWPEEPFWRKNTCSCNEYLDYYKSQFALEIFKEYMKYTALQPENKDIKWIQTMTINMFRGWLTAILGLKQRFSKAGAALLDAHFEMLLKEIVTTCELSEDLSEQLRNDSFFKYLKQMVATISGELPNFTSRSTLPVRFVRQSNRVEPMVQISNAERTQGGSSSTCDLLPELSQWNSLRYQPVLNLSLPCSTCL